MPFFKNPIPVKPKTLGIPYKGSKSLIAERLLLLLPSADYFVDLFAGGCAMTHAAVLSNKYRRIIANDITDIPRLFVDAARGKYSQETRWISKEDFMQLKNTEPFIRTCWSFGNNNRTYIYSKAIEPYKKACHYAVVFNDWSLLEPLCPEIIQATKVALDGISDLKTRRLRFGPAIVKWLKQYGSAELVNGNPLYKSAHWRGGFPGKNGQATDLESLRSLEHLERLQSLEAIGPQALDRITCLQSDYRSVEIPDNATVYCDIPYKSTEDYGTKFNHDEFYEWALSRPFNVYISEYDMPEPFREIASFNHRSRISATVNKACTEKLFCNH